MLLFDELRRLIINSGNPGQSGPFDELGRLLVTDVNKRTGTGGDAPAATTTTAGIVRAATAAESVQATGRINLAWSIDKLRALFATGRGAPATLANVSVPANVVNGGTIAIPLSSPMVPGQLIEIIIQDGTILPDLAGSPLIPAATILSILRAVTATPTETGTAADFISYETHRGGNSANSRAGFSHAALYVGRTDASTLVLGHSHWTTFDNADLSVQVYAH